MKLFAPLALLTAGLLAAGCVSHRPRLRPAPAPAVLNDGSATAAPPQIVTPDDSLTAKVVSYDSAGQFVVLNFPVGQMPATNQKLYLYREGLKVGEVKITGPQADDNVVADIVTGEAQVGDEVRAQ
ncbi:MAG TPA: hypothetical protein VMD27_13970 [Candidatus Aquilonibacter sp.]|nr:hypothetical protein [Candidatus Aquilonibacter sp.]